MFPLHKALPARVLSAPRLRILTSASAQISAPASNPTHIRKLIIVDCPSSLGPISNRSRSSNYFPHSFSPGFRIAMAAQKKNMDFCYLSKLFLTKTIKVKLFLHPQSCWTRCHYLVTVRSFPVVTCWSLTPVSDPTLQKFSPGGKITLQTTWQGFVVFFAFSSIDPSSVYLHPCCSWHNRTPAYEDTVEIC